MKISFVKLSGTGNDFIAIDNREKVLPADLSHLSRKLCQRKYSIGADGLLILENTSSNDLMMRIFNPDGSEAEMCGNGARCLSYLVYRKKIRKGDKVKLKTLSGPLYAEIKDSSVRLKMPDPVNIQRNVKIKVGKKEFNVFYINTGVPHSIIFVSRIDNVPVESLGRVIRFHRHFSPAGTNVDFVWPKDHKTILVRTYERGVEEETRACGTGAVAGAIIAGIENRVTPPICVKTLSGDTLSVHYRLIPSKAIPVIRDVYLEGEVKLVYEGNIEV